jgi:hypothetical protein
MDSTEKTHRNCKYFDTFKCLLRKYHDLMDKIDYALELFVLLSFSNNYSERLRKKEEYLEALKKCNEVCTGFDKFESKETD